MSHNAIWTQTVIFAVVPPPSVRSRRWGPRWTRWGTRSTKRTLVSCRRWGVSSREPIRTAGSCSIAWGRPRGRGCATPRRERLMRSCSGVWSRTWRWGGEGRRLGSMCLCQCSLRGIWRTFCHQLRQARMIIVQVLCILLVHYSCNCLKMKIKYEYHKTCCLTLVMCVIPLPFSVKSHYDACRWRRMCRWGCTTSWRRWRRNAPRRKRRMKNWGKNSSRLRWPNKLCRMNLKETKR